MWNVSHACFALSDATPNFFLILREAIIRRGPSTGCHAGIAAYHTTRVHLVGGHRETFAAARQDAGFTLREEPDDVGCGDADFRSQSGCGHFATVSESQLSPNE